MYRMELDFFDIKPEDFELVDYDQWGHSWSLILRFSDKSKVFDAWSMGEILSRIKQF